MIRAIVTAIASALRTFVRVIGAIAMAPFRVINRVICGDAPQEIQAPAPYEYGDEASETFDRQALYMELANRIMAWAAESIVADRPVPLATQRMPLSLREWLPGLTRDECAAIIGTDERAVSAHLQRLFALPGVRTVQRLPRIDEWPPAPWSACDEGSPSFTAYARDGARPAQSRARVQAARSSIVAPG